MTNQFVLPLADQQAVLEKVGGKGASLARLASAGLPVPGGFHVTTDAYRQFVADNDLQPHILAALEPVDVSQPATLEEASQAIFQFFMQAAMPTPITEAITQAYQDLSAQPVAVAVRSSATAEDLPEASFAGQQETYLNITGVDAVLEAVKKCWASLWTARAISYRMRQNIAPKDVALAVVVQELVFAEAAGILFTANPMNGRRDVMVINAAWGLGEAIVGGRVTPDTIIVDKTTGQLKHVQVAEKMVLTALTEQGTIEQPVKESQRKIRVLDDARAVSLVELGRRIEAHYGAPQDIEWCGKGNQILIVQSRPITTLFPLPTPLPAPEDGLRLYTCVNVVLQGLTEPFTPMGFEMFHLMYTGMLDGLTGNVNNANPSWVKNAAGRLYLDITDLMHNSSFGEKIIQRMANKDPLAIKMILKVYQENKRYFRTKQKIQVPRAGLRKIIPNLLKPALQSYFNPQASREKMLAFGNNEFVLLDRRVHPLKGMEDRLLFVDEVARKLFWTTFFEVSYCNSGLRAVEKIPSLLKKWLGSDTLAQPVLQALPHNPTTEMGQELLRIARQMQIEKTVPVADHPAVQEFLRRFGHRAIREIDIGMPRWSDDPTYVLEMLATYVKQDNLEAKQQEFRKAQLEAEAAIPRITAEVRRRKSGLHARIVGYLLRCLREVGGMREQPKFDFVRCLALLRRVLFEVGEELVAQGRLERAEDVFFVTFVQIREGGDLRLQAAEAQAEYLREIKRIVVPRVMTSNGECFYGAAAHPDEKKLVGSPVSAGVYEGIAHIIDSPIGAQLVRGEILVTHSTDPSWTPLFLNAGAVIMETGGPISHGAIVAREYGIPAVAGVSEAATRLHTGQRLRVNGETGEVIFLE